ncbi:HopJ type III effector protein [Marinobacter halotolerans]|uniref:HopJ type III effector protein n=1 Tax=Marinobacter halotolerans TaxID=1569211 RepID=UPI0012440877|nr:HopJ type III effector protein [Marinobacter halotolerans]
MNVNERVRVHLASLAAGHSRFSDTLELISQSFDYQPVSFRNGPLANAAGENEGSCRVFSLAQYCNLNESDTLRLFAEHYQQVLDDPAGESHGNIRQFMTTGWSGVSFDKPPLRKRPAAGQEDTTEESS